MGNKKESELPTIGIQSEGISIKMQMTSANRTRGKLKRTLTAIWICRDRARLFFIKVLRFHRQEKAAAVKEVTRVRSSSTANETRNRAKLCVQIADVQSPWP